VFLYRALNDPQPPPEPTANIERTMPPNAEAPASAPASDQSGLAEAAIRRGQQALTLGDIPAARAQFEQAGQAGDAAGALAAGKTYDPDFLPRHPVPRTLPDRAKAIAWYQRSAALGNRDAAQLLAHLQRQTR
jgi:TPR repeat protein